MAPPTPTKYHPFNFKIQEKPTPRLSFPYDFPLELHPPFFPSRSSPLTYPSTSSSKMTKNLANVDTSDKLIPLQRPSRNYNTLAFNIPSCRTSTWKESFYPRTTKDWNALKDASVGAPSLEAYKAYLRQ